jgi:hypothetical protein
LKDTVLVEGGKNGGAYVLGLEPFQRFDRDNEFIVTQTDRPPRWINPWNAFCSSSRDTNLILANFTATTSQL